MKELEINFGMGVGLPWEKITEGYMVKLDLMKSENDVFQQNKLKIIDAALSIEATLERMLLDYFFGGQIYEDVKRYEFENMVLSSSWFTFGNKHRLVITTLKNRGFLCKKDLDLLNSLLHKVAEYRNAFTHGKHKIDTPFCCLTHFKNESIDTELSDDYFIKMEKRFHDCNEILSFLSCRIGYTIGKYSKPPNQDYPSPPDCMKGKYD
tara:strand:- start:4 stop:627 length:624 start_codon:yes stop_codon:yes gene_type:complete